MIDWSRVAELHDEIGREDLAEVVALFLEETDEVMDGLAQCDGRDALHTALHFLKGSALNLGFQRLAKLCRDGEHHDALGPEQLAQLITCYADSKDRFLTRLQDPADFAA
ncbi:MAG: Hpt domain-containing protein [Pseudorhodobacter sp.]